MKRMLTKADRDTARTNRINYLKTTYSAEVTEAEGVTFAKWSQQHGERITFYLEYWQGKAGNSTYNAYRQQADRDKAAENLQANALRLINYRAEQKEKNKGHKTSHAAAAAAIREELKTAFPAIKFKVTSESFSKGDAVRVHWTDGPTMKQVEAYTGKYQYGHFNGMEDIYEYSNRVEGLPQVKYVTESRSISDEIQEQIKAALIAEKYPIEDNGHWSEQQIINRIFSASPIPPGAKVTGIQFNNTGDNTAIIEVPEEPAKITPPKVEIQPGKVQVIEYSEKALAVIGDTKSIKDKLKELGGSFNPRLTCGPGWIFSKTKAEQLRAAFAPN